MSSGNLRSRLEDISISLTNFLLIKKKDKIVGIRNVFTKTNKKTSCLAFEVTPKPMYVLELKISNKA